jgi:hypothetical protein
MAARRQEGDDTEDVPVPKYEEKDERDTQVGIPRK